MLLQEIIICGGMILTSLNEVEITITKYSHFGRFRFSGLSFSQGKSNNGITPQVIYQPTAISVPRPGPQPVPEPVPAPIPQTVTGRIPQTILEPV